MNTFINRFATPLTTGLFLVSLVSGVALFFHWASSAFHSMHVWLSMVLLLPVVLHVWKNWKGLMSYLRHKTLLIPLALSLVVAVPFAVSGMTGSGRGGNPAFRAIPLLTQAPLSDLAPLLKTTPDALLTTLKQKGYNAASADQTLDAIAGGAGEQSSRLLFSLMPAR